MAENKKYLHNLEIGNNKVMNLLLNPLTTIQRIAVGAGLGLSDQSYVCYDTTLNQQYFWDGTQWITVGGGGGGSWGTITGVITAQTDLINYLSSNYYPLSTNPANYLTGSGVATRVAFWNTGSSISSDSALYWDNSNKYLGIGTATPTKALDVISDAKVNGALLGIGPNSGSSFPNSNIVFGTNALAVNTTGYYNAAIGTNAMSANTTGYYNLAIGYDALKVNLISRTNIAIGAASLGKFIGDSTVNGGNTGIGALTLRDNVTGLYNTAIGYGSILSITGSSYNAAIGYSALRYATSGTYNTAIGTYSGSYYGALGTSTITTVNNGTFIGYYTRPLNNSSTNEIVIGFNAVGNGDNSTTIGNSGTTSTNLFGSLGFGSTPSYGTSGQVLISQGSGVAPIWTTLTANISGTGTTNYVPKWSSSSALTDSQIFDNGSNVGIGTATPGYKLDVTGTGRFTSTLYADTDLIVNNYFTINTTATTYPSGYVGIYRRKGNGYGTFFQEDEQGGSLHKWAFIQRTGYGGTRDFYNNNSSIVNINYGWGQQNSSNYNAATLLIDPTINITNALLTGTVVRGIYYNPTLTSLTNTKHIGFENTTGDNYLNSTSGSTLIGYASGTATTFKLDVNGAYQQKYYTDTSNASFRMGSGYELYGELHSAGGYQYYLTNSYGWGSAWTLNIGTNTNKILSIANNLITANQPFTFNNGWISGQVSTYQVSPYTGVQYQDGSAWNYVIRGTTGGNYFILGNTGALTLSNLSGTGTRMVVASSAGLLSTQTIPSGSTSPLTTKGDIYTYSTVDTRLPVGLDTQVLLADSSTATGLKWGTNTAATPLGYYLSISDSTTQTNPTANTPRAVKFNTTDLFNGFSLQTETAVFTGTINNGGAGAGTILNVTGVTSGTLKVGMELTGGSITAGTFISAFTSGTGGIGTYVVSVSQNRASATYTGTMTSEIVCANTGVYNLQFSSQLKKTDSGEDDVNFWLRINGLDVPKSAGNLSLQGNAPAFMIAAWNYVLQLYSNDVIELYWASPDDNMSIYSEVVQTSPYPHPAIQSTILTITQQSGIMAGTGIARSVNSVSINTSAGNGANVDYVYLVSGTTIITLPTAVGNTNRYTIKRSGTGVVSIATTSSQTIDGSASPITINVQNVSLDLISNGTNWEII